MNPANLIARSSRQNETDSASVPPTTGHDFAPPERRPGPAQPDANPHQPAADVLRLRHALAQMLSRATEEEIHSFEGPVATNDRLCAIADNIWNRRPWSA